MGPVVRIVAAMLALLPVGQLWAGQDANLESAANRTSYAIGVDMARNFKKQGIEIDPELILRGMKDGYAGTAQISDKELRRTMNSFQGEVRQKMAQNRRLAADENKTRGADFLSANKGKAGVVTLPSGLQYRVVNAGAADGRKPQESDLVECNYRGTLLSGAEFDSTEPGKPATLKVSALIAGWREALKMMPAGAKWQLFVPPQLAYGDRGAGSDIGPNETLVFEVELVAIK
ncbi:MAG: FKBP-type peptidyl-prolyl cis-trans isomerase [Rhodocyclales bacterium]|nr:FKBP-type peptidyl-prolyl cis-trans isomerase [Rhodocyclales bacterium]